LTAAKSKAVQTGMAAIILLSIVSLPFLQNIQAQNATAFLPADKFSIPERHGSISFAVNGSYSSAVLENNTWIFNDLTLNSSAYSGTLKISAQGSNITITEFRPFTAFSRSQVVRYIAEGEGVQTVNFDINYATDPREWSVTLSRTVYLNEGENWHLLPDDTVVVTGQSGNVSVAHYKLDIPDDSGLPFYQQHSVALATIAVVAATVLAAVLIRVKVRS